MQSLDDANKELFFLLGLHNNFVQGYFTCCSYTFFNSLSINSNISILLLKLFSKLDTAKRG